MLILYSNVSTSGFVSIAAGSSYTEQRSRKHLVIVIQTPAKFSHVSENPFEKKKYKTVPFLTLFSRHMHNVAASFFGELADVNLVCETRVSRPEP